MTSPRRPDTIAPVLQRMAAIDVRFGRTRGPEIISRRHGQVAQLESHFASTLASAEVDVTSAPQPDHVTDAGTSGVEPTPIDVATTTGVTVATSTVPPAGTALPAGIPFAADFERAGRQHGVAPSLLAAVSWVESRFQTDALSPDGAIGLMQIMPMTAQELGVDPHDPIDAIDGAARLLASHHERFGSWDLALAAYHSGAGAVSRAGNQAPPRAAVYVQRVHDRLSTT